MTKHEFKKELEELPHLISLNYRMKITKKDYNFAVKILKKYFPYQDFLLSENGRVYRDGGRSSSDSDFVETGVDTLLAIVLDLSKNKC